MKYKEWLNEWLDYYVQPRTKQRTYEKYYKQIHKHVLPVLGDYDMDDLTAVTLQKFIAALIDKGLSANTVNGVITLLKTSLQRAVSVGVAQRQYSDFIVRPKTREKQVECFSKDEQKKIERYVFDKNKPKLFGIVLCLYTGLRIGELLALTWDDVDLQKGIICVSKSCHDSWENGEYVKVIDEPKTESSMRIIPFPKQLLPRLKELKKLTKSGYVIGGEHVHGTQVRSYQKTFETLLKKLKISHKGFHSLRHTFATRALECGMDVKTLSEILGHKNPMVTLKRYAHSMLEHKAEMMNRVGKLLS